MVKDAVDKKEAVWKEVLGARNVIAKEETLQRREEKV